MQTLRQTLQIFLPLAVGIGLLVALPALPALVEFEHALVWNPGNSKGHPHYKEPGNKADFQIQVFQQTSTPGARTITTHRIDPETEDILGTSPLQPANWAYLLSQLKPEKTPLLVITNELSWDDAEEIPIRALQHQLSRFPASVIGLACEKTGDRPPIPAYLQPSIISEFNGYPPNLPEIDKVTAPPSVQATYFGVSSIAGLKINPGDQTITIPLLIKWHDQILPSVELAALLAEFKIKPSELIIDPRGYLRLNKDGPIFFEIDDRGFTETYYQPNESAPVSKFLTAPDNRKNKGIIIAQNDSERLKLFAGLYHHLARASQRHAFTIQRWALVIEATFLILLILSFTTRRLWPALLLIGTGYLVSSLCNQWFLISPVIALLIAYFLFFRSKSSSSPQDPQTPAAASSK